jgi:hypothetical protein
MEFMHVKRFALIFGILALAVGIISFIPALSEYPSWLPVLKIDTSYGVFMGVPMNIFNKIILIVFGALGIGAATIPGKNLPYSIAYSRLVFAFMGCATILGLIPQTSTLNGYMPLFGNDALAHGIFSLMGAYFGFVLTLKTPHMPPSNDGRQPTRSGRETFKHS